MTTNSPIDLIDFINRNINRHSAKLIAISYQRYWFFGWRYRYNCTLEFPKLHLIMPIGKPIEKNNWKLIIPIGKPIEKNNWKLIIPIGKVIMKAMGLRMELGVPVPK